MIKKGISKQKRFDELYKTSKEQLELLNKTNFIKSMKYISNSTYIDAHNPNNENDNKKNT